MAINNNINLSPHTIARQKHWGWSMAIGIILLVIGSIAAVSLPFATVAVTIYIGLMMIIGGLIQIIHAFTFKKSGRFVIWLIAGAIYTVAGIVCWIEPVVAAVIFTFLLGILLLAAGILRIIVGVQHRDLSNWGWIVAAGVISALLGILITTGWPENSLWILGLFLAIDLMFQGWSLIAFSLGLKAYQSL